MISRRVLTILVTAACVLPIAIVVVLAVGRLLGAMKDTDAADVLDRVALAIGIAWAINLVCLLLAQGVSALEKPPEPPDAET